MNTDKLIKLLMLTTSENDNEALASIRAANKILSSHKQTWLDILNPIVVQETKAKQPEPDIANIVRKPPGEILNSEIEVMFEYVLDDILCYDDEFILSVYEFFEEKGYLTEKQILVLQKIIRKTL